MQISLNCLFGCRRFSTAAACVVQAMAMFALSGHAAAAGDGARAYDTRRIVSIGGAVTEILYALGKDKNIVGIDTTSLYPPRAAGEKASVGYMRQLSAEGVLGLNPSLIVAIEGSGPKETMAVLEAAHVPMIVVPDSYIGDGIVEKVRRVAAAVGAEERGQCIAQHVRADLDRLAQFERGIDKPKRVMFVLSMVSGRAMVAGTRTAADGIIRLAGAVNAVTDYEGYKTINDEAVIAAKPDAILVMERGGSTLTADSVFASPAFATTPAGATRTFIGMDGLYLLGFGPRTAGAARDLASALYPQLKSEPLPSERAAAPGTACRD